MSGNAAKNPIYNIFMQKSITVSIPGSLSLDPSEPNSLTQAEGDQVFVLLRKAGFTQVEFGGDSSRLTLTLGAENLEIE